MSVLSDIAKAAETVGGWGISALTGLGLAGGYSLAKLISPRAIAENADRELTLEALNTEIAVTQRRIAALERRRDLQKSTTKSDNKKYDRFV